MSEATRTRLERYVKNIILTKESTINNEMDARIEREQKRKAKECRTKYVAKVKSINAQIKALNADLKEDGREEYDDFDTLDLDHITKSDFEATEVVKEKEARLAKMNGIKSQLDRIILIGDMNDKRVQDLLKALDAI